MNRVCNISKERLENFLKEGKTTRQIASELRVTNTTISRYIRNYNLNYLYKKPKYSPYHLTEINNKKIAYLLGFIIADASINNETVEISVAVKDSELIKLFSSILGINYRIDNTLIKESKGFPRMRLVRKIIGIRKFIGGNKKKDRNVPIIKKDLEVYMIRGIFDADGCITWGYRKDRNRIWHKISFTSTLSILTSVQKILYKIGISTIVRSKSKEDCYVLEFANKNDILKFYDYLYADKSFIPLRRKFTNYNALRLELGEFGETVKHTIPSSVLDSSKKCVETTGELNRVLNNQSSTQDL